ncbi:Eco57I restriction-modification methylase domain-containing protein [Patescibacteria group bacterium]|nr:Eco57I restriction-modification methylase domain-containing protein [Patescibacteria group bacterium]
MKLFKDKIIKERLKNFDIPDIDFKISKIKNWLNMYEDKSLHKKTETQCEQPFSQDIFIDILGYKSLPSEVYSIEPKAKTETSGQKPDVILGYFSDKENIRKVNAVVEYKDVNKSLDKPQQREGNFSPVQQAFKYKPQYSSCDFVIVSNFYEIRLYKDNQLDYEIFTLKDLCNPEDNYYQFKKFYYLLCSDNLIKKEGISITYDLISKIRIEQEVITNNFYKEYKEIRYKLLQNIYQKNSIARDNSIFLIKKTQTIIDRVIFICFCEDRDLLPDNTLQILLKQSEEALSSFWDSLKGLFNLINYGHDKLGIPNGYNGGLFKEDLEFNNLKIDDNILKDIVNFCKYDFSEDLSVNILGHIFEQSISDLEEIKIKIENKNKDENFLEQISKRKKDGIFYTPDYITDYIVKNSLGKYLEEKENQLKSEYNLKENIKDATYKKREIEVYTEYQKNLQNIKVLDPACGSGAFLVKVFDYLLEENRRVGKILNSLFSSDIYIKSILENNIYGVDLNEESVEITKLSLWLKTAQKRKKLTSLDNNIKCGNSLISDPEVAGEKAFKWEEEFKEIIDKGGFDVIVGNPPYVRADIDNPEYKKQRKWLENSDEYETLYEKWDLMVAFFEKGLKLLKQNGYFSFIASNAITTSKYAYKLQDWILKNFSIKNLDYYEDIEVFENVGVVPFTIVIKNEKLNLNDDFLIKKIVRKKDFLNETIFNIKQDINNRKSVFKKVYNEIKINTDTIKLGDICYISYGLRPNSDERFWKGEFKKDDLISNKKDNLHSRKYIEGKNIKRYLIEKIHFLEWNTERSPKKFVRQTFPELYEGEKIMIGGMTGGILDSSGIICNHSITIIKKFYNLKSIENKSINSSISKNNNLSRNKLEDISQNFNLKYILAILNSKFANNFLNNNRRSTIKNSFYPDDFRNLLIPKIKLEKQDIFAKKVEIITQLNKSFQEKVNKFLELLKSDFSIEKVSTKLNKWNELEWEEFKKELKKQKIILKGEQEENWFDRFNRLKIESNNLQEEINKTDDEINRMVYNLYEITEEEIKIIENDN